MGSWNTYYLLLTTYYLLLTTYYNLALGSWNTRQHRVTSFGDCVARCVGCARCRYVTYAADEDDCSWCVLQPATQGGAGCNPKRRRLQP